MGILFGISVYWDIGRRDRSNKNYKYKNKTEKIKK
jgi:hypothetical protein